MKSRPYTYKVYRGIALREALDVLIEQRYFRGEKTQFNSYCGANAVFGEGAYFTEHFELAAGYAECHAFRSKDHAAVLVQHILLQRPLFLNEAYTEKQLRMDVLNWRIGEEKVRKLFQSEQAPYVHLAESIRAYVLSQGYDSIVMRLPDGAHYFVAFKPDLQVKNIHLDFSFSLSEALSNTYTKLRQAYKRERKLGFYHMQKLKI